MTSFNETSVSESSFLPEGYERAIGGIDAVARSEVEERCADQRNASGFVKRCFLQRRIDRETVGRVADVRPIFSLTRFSGARFHFVTRHERSLNVYRGGRRGPAAMRGTRAMRASLLVHP